MALTDPSPVAHLVEAIVPKWQETLFGVDLALLLASPVFYGVGIKRGNGEPVVLIPGFMHGDTYLLLLYYWLARIGYSPYFSGIGFNADCPNLLARDVIHPVLRRAVARHRRKVHLIGHSFGGVIARSLAAQFPALVSSVITLGAPYGRSALHREVLEEAEIVRRYIVRQHRHGVRPECYTPECPCAFMRALKNGVPKRVLFSAIYTVNDGILEWESCRTGDPAIDAEVKGTHAGLVFNPAVYRIIAERLSAAVPKMRARAKASGA